MELKIIYCVKNKDDIDVISEMVNSQVEGLGLVVNKKLTSSQLIKSDTLINKNDESEYDVCGKDYNHAIILTVSEPDNHQSKSEYVIECFDNIDIRIHQKTKK